MPTIYHYQTYLGGRDTETFVESEVTRVWITLSDYLRHGVTDVSPVLNAELIAYLDSMKFMEGLRTGKILHLPPHKLYSASDAAAVIDQIYGSGLDG